MKHSTEAFLELVNEAYQGRLRLPAFQRDWAWKSPSVLSLYDSLRKQFPIGSFLLIEASTPDFLSPRPLHGVEDPPDEPKRLILDGQQRITAGIGLLHGAGKARFFIDLKQLNKLLLEKEISPKDEEKVQIFVQDLDDDDDYLKTIRNAKPAKDLLLNQHLLPIACLTNQASAKKQLKPFLDANPNLVEFVDYVLLEHFLLPASNQCPAVTLDDNESLTAVTRIFSTLNTTGKRLTPVEIVKAVLFADNIDIGKKVDEYHEASEYLENMDPTGVIMLQTVALLSGESPKKSLLPKTITHKRFNKHFEDALSLLDDVGEFLTNRLGVGLASTRNLLPYDSILAPMAAVIHQVGWSDLTGNNKAKADQCLETWFVAAALSQRYQEGVHNKQSNDTESITTWIESGNDEDKPAWIVNTVIRQDLHLQSPKGAIGKLLRCLMNRAQPEDPLDGTQIGFYHQATTESHDHHIWPKSFCSDKIAAWNDNLAKADVALNIMPLSKKTNTTWLRDDPKLQISTAKDSRGSDAVAAAYERVMVSAKCLEIMKKPIKTQQDFIEFLNARATSFATMIKKWNIRQATSVDQPDEVEVE